jgi:hypothetical protein
VLLAVVTLAAALIGGPAQAVPVTVGGTTYDVQFNTSGTNGASFNEDSALIQASPWWGSAAQANDFAVAYGAQVGPNYPFDLNGAVEYLLFSHVTSGGLNNAEFLSEGGGVGNFFNLSNSSNFSNAYYAYASSPTAAVPEIDGNALAQAGLILLALFLVLRGRRPDMA